MVAEASGTCRALTTCSVWPEPAPARGRPVEGALTAAAWGQGPGSFLLRSDIFPSSSDFPLCRFFKRIPRVYERDLVLNLPLHNSASAVAGPPALFRAHTQGTDRPRLVLRDQGHSGQPAVTTPHGQEESNDHILLRPRFRRAGLTPPLR